MPRLHLRALIPLGLLLYLAACSDDDPIAPAANRAPAAVQLSAPNDGQSGLDGDVVLSWQPAADPDGDTVTYSVFLDETVDPSTEVASGIDANQHVADSELQIGTTYHWKVTASDGRGGESTSAVRSFTTRVNNPPGAFSLLELADGATGVDQNPTLTWSAAVDPDGDAVVYDLYLDDASLPTTAVANDLTMTSYTVAASLGVEEQYSWRVVARDELGAETPSETRRFTTRPLVVATRVTDDAAFAGRAGHSSVVFDPSTDGETWTAATENAAFPARSVHSSVVFDGRMWVIGGNRVYSSGNEFADVWSSSDGITWIQETADAAFGPRYGHRSVVFDGKIWVYSGRDVARSYGRSEIWQSGDGVTWTRVSEDAQYGGTSNFRITEFQGALWKTGGLDDRVFRSEDGIDWTVMQEEAAYGERYQHTTVVFDDRLWLISGSNQSSQTTELPDVWSSANGIDWQRAASDAGFTPVAAHSSVSFAGRIWVIAGGGGLGGNSVTNEVYSLGY